MTIEVELPDGSIVEFPEGTSNTVITQTIRKMAGSQAQAAQPKRQSWQEYLGGIPAMAAQGASFNFMDEIGAGIDQGIRAVGLPNPSGKASYDESLAHYRAGDKAYMDENPVTSIAAQAAGGLATGVGLGGAGVTAGRLAAPNASFLARSGASALDGLGFGAVNGFGAGQGGSDGRLAEAALQGGVGGVVGGAAPVIGEVLKTVSAPVVSQAAARIDPRGYANRQVAKTVMDSGRSPQQIAQELNQAAQEGQSVYRLGDALGSEGQNLMATASNAPGPGRAAIDEFLRGRNADAPRRVGGFLQEAAGTPQTAAQLQDAMESAARARADANYGAARAEAMPVDVSPAVQRADEFLRTGDTGTFGTQLFAPEDSITGQVQRARQFLTTGKPGEDPTATQFDVVFRAKKELDGMIERAAGNPSAQRELIPIKQAIDDALAKASSPYEQARNTFRTDMQAVDAIGTGRDAATRGRFEDTIPQFQRMPQEQQAAFRGGYFDKLATDVQNRPFGEMTDVTVPLRTPSLNEEIPRFAQPGTGDLTMRRLSREQQMAEMLKRSRGGSRTAENMANAEAAGVDPGVVGSLLTGNVSGALRQFGSGAYNAMSGNTPAVREQLARLLMSRGDVAPMIESATKTLQQRQALAAALARLAPISAASTMSQSQPQ